MATLENSRDVPSSVMEMLEIFLAASSRGEHATLILESRMKKLTTKYRCVEKVAESPAPHDKSKSEKKKKRQNPSRQRRSKLRLETFLKRKAASGSQKQIDPPQKQLIVQLESQQVQDDASHGEAVCIPQLDGIIENVVEVQPEVEEKVTFTFISNYGEEDVLDSLEELKEAKSVPDSTQLVSRYRTKPLSADHLCVVVMNLPVGQAHFTWPELPGYPDFFQDVQRV